MKINAAIARDSSQPLSLEQITIEEPRADEIRVKVVATGICHTDLVVKAGLLPTPMPVVLGHEGAGIVESVGENVTHMKPGDHVVMTFNYCNHCPSCDEEAYSYCHEFFPRNFFAVREDGTSALSQNDELIHGNFFGQSSFATYAICHTANAVKVPKTANLKEIAPLACGIQTGAGAICKALEVKANSSVVVFGTGSVGLSAIMTAKLLGASTIIAVDTKPERRVMAQELGATHVIDPLSTKASEEIIKITDYGVNFALDTTGIPEVIRDAVESLAPIGRCGILGASGPDAEIKLNETHFMSGGRSLIGIVEGSVNPHTFIPQMIDWQAQGMFPFEKLIKFYTPENINQAIEDTETGVSIKPVICWE